MRIGVVLVTIFLLFAGCSQKEQNSVKKRLVVGEQIGKLALKNQHGNASGVTNQTKSVIFAFSKDAGHECNDYLATKEPSYLEHNSALFVADVSSAPYMIRSMFIVPGLREFEHNILIIDDKDISNAYKPSKNSEKIVVAKLNRGVISEIVFVDSTDQLDEVIRL